jgi:AcrR family transcriptional regulator
LVINQKENKKHAAKLKILQSSLKLIEEYGFDVLTIRDICEEAKISTGTFYHYFSGKEDLLTFYIAQGFTDYFKVIKQYPPEDKIMGVIDILSYYAGYFQSMGVELLSNYMSPKKQALNIDKIIAFTENKDVVEYILKQFSEAQALGFFNKDEDLKSIYEELNAVFYGVAFLWCLHSGNFEMKQKVRKMLIVQLNAHLDSGYKILEKSL